MNEPYQVTIRAEKKANYAGGMINIADCRLFGSRQGAKRGKGILTSLYPEEQILSRLCDSMDGLLGFYYHSIILLAHSIFKEIIYSNILNACIEEWLQNED